MWNKEYKKSHTSVFTMMEMVVAISILVIVFLTAASGLLAVQQSWKRGAEHSDKLSQLIMIDKVVNANFRNIIPYQWRDRELLTMRQVFSGHSDSIVFASLHRVNDPQEGGIRFISIFVEDGKLIALYRKTPLLYWNADQMDGNTEILAEGVESIEFLYGDMNRDRELEWFDQWDEETEKYIPMAVQMKINWQDGTSDVWLRRVAGVSKRSNLGKKFYMNRI